MPRYKVTATLTYEVECANEDDVYESADELWVLDVERAEVDVTRVREMTTAGAL